MISQETLHIFIEHWELILFVIGSIIGGVVWAMHRIFVTHEHLNRCRYDVSKETSEKVAQLSDKNTEEHNEIRTDVRQILNHLLGKD